jgi:hypothetical protein
VQEREREQDTCEMSSFAAKMKAKAAKTAEKAKSKAKKLNEDHSIVEKTKSAGRKASRTASSVVTTTKTKIDGALTPEQQENAMMGATLGLTALSMVGAPGAGTALTGIALGTTAASLHEQQKAQNHKLSTEQMIGAACSVGGAVGGTRTKLVIGAMALGMKEQKNEGGKKPSSGGGGNMLQQVKQAKKAMDLGKKIGLTPTQALKGARMANQSGLI